MPTSKTIKPRIFRLHGKKLITILIVLSLLAGGLWLGIKNSRQDKTSTPTDTPIEAINLSPATKEERNEAETKKLQELNSTTSSTGSVPPTATSANTARISGLYQDNSSKNIIVQTELQGTRWEQCTLTMTRGNQSVVKTAKTIYQSSYSSCLGFSVDSAELSSGQWVVNLTARTTDGSVISAPNKSIDVEK